MTDKEKIAFLVLNLTDRGGLAGSSPLWNSFRGSEILYTHNEISGISVDVFNSSFELIERWEREIICDSSPISPKGSERQSCGLWEALRQLEKTFKDKVLVMPDFNERLFLQVALFCWQIELYPKNYLDLLSYTRGVLDAKGRTSEESDLEINNIVQKIQESRDLRAKLNYCVELYRRLQELPRRIKQTEKQIEEKDGDRWLDNGGCWSSPAGC